MWLKFSIVYPFNYSTSRTFWMVCVPCDRWHSKQNGKPIMFHVHDTQATLAADFRIKMFGFSENRAKIPISYL